MDKKPTRLQLCNYLSKLQRKELVKEIKEGLIFKLLILLVGISFAISDFILGQWILGTCWSLLSFGLLYSILIKYRWYKYLKNGIRIN